jgi:hypothetical protein
MIYTQRSIFFKQITVVQRFNSRTGKCQKASAISPWIQAALDQGGELDVVCIRYSEAKLELSPLNAWLEKNQLRYIALITDAPIEDLDIIISERWSAMALPNRS